MGKLQSTALSVALVAVLILGTGTEGQNLGGHWVTAWSAAMHTVPAIAALPPQAAFENQTVRMVVRSTLGGGRVRVRFSNEFGTTPLKIGGAHIALVRQGGSFVPDSERVLRFGAKMSVSVPPGAPMLSDPVDLKLPAFAELAVSIYLPDKTTATTTHLWAQHETYIVDGGDFSAQADIPNATVQTAWYFLSDVEVWASDQAATIVAFGDSITDGVGVKPGEYGDWPDLLAKRLAGELDPRRFAVANEGISGNRILHDGAGISALARFDRDVLAKPGVDCVILLEGINDIGWPNLKPRPLPDRTTPKEMPFAGEVVSAQDIIVGLEQIIERAHSHGIKVFGATLTPYEGSDYYTAVGEVTRQAVNQWMRMSNAFDGLFDFDVAVRDPGRPSKFREDYQAGDHLHPSAAGYKAMANAVDVSLLRKSLAVGPKR